MRVAVIGAGRIGGNIARRLADAGHEVSVSFARNSAALEALAAEIGATVAPPADVVESAEVVVFSVPWDALPKALAAAGSLEGKLVIDTTNQFGSGPMPQPGRTAASFNAGRMAGARYTKSFNTLTAAFQVRVAGGEPPVVQWLCGDDEEAKGITSGLIADAGYIAVDVGGVDGCEAMEAPRRDGAVYGEEYRLPEAQAALAAIRAGQPIPPPPAYEDQG